MKQPPTNRIRIISFFILAFAIFIISRLYILQVVENEAYLQKADRQYAGSFNIFNRGLVSFSSKDGSLIPAATLKNGYTVAINPTILLNKEEVYEKIKDLVNISKEDFILKASKKMILMRF